MNGRHDPWIDRLSEFLDGDLSPREAQAVEEHLQACPSCRAVREDLEEVRRRARALPDREPARDLWPDVRERLGEDPLAEKIIPLKQGRPASTGRSARFSFSAPQAAAAAMVLLAGGWLAGTTLAPEQGSVTLSDRRPNAEFVGLDGNIPGFPGALSRELASLERRVLEGLDELEPTTRATLLRNLDVIDRAIRESLDALSREPGSDYLRGHLGGALERKRAYLERMSTLMEA
ncbi:MAG: zf-HC2 domain-containing protein [Gemmatimonadales bacterium]|nr:MAG: zf-HC2 domain-containing protein [Gemmatimonadales bacterium]